ALAQSESRWQGNIKGRSPSEVLLAIRSLAGARLEYVQTVRDLDKAQVRLLVLTAPWEIRLSLSARGVAEVARLPRLVTTGVGRLPLHPWQIGFRYTGVSCDTD